MILNKDVLVNNIVTELSDNSTGQISPYDIRHNLLDIIDSVPLLASGYPINAPNVATLSYRTTKVGENTLTTVGLAGHISRDNTAIGHSTLKANFQGTQNTAIGSQALFCNVYGEHNVGLGFSALAGNTIGDGNVGIGNFTLHNNKSGKFNIAIGHGAGYYLKDQSNKFVVSSYNINSDFICANPDGSGIIPFLYGDLSQENPKLGIATRTLHNEGVLQTSGAITPSITSSFDIGSVNYRWKNLYINSLISFSPAQYIQRSSDTSIDIASDLNLYGSINVTGDVFSSGNVTVKNVNVSGNIIPLQTSTYDIGSPSKLWSYGYFDNIYVSGLSTFNRIVAYETCNVFCKSIDLASSGSISLDGGGAQSIYDYQSEPPPFADDCGYLTDEQLYGAGFNINSSGVDYSRTYSFTFSPPVAQIDCDDTADPYALASWNSNISLHLAEGTHLKTDKIIFPSSVSIVQQTDCVGIFSREDDFFVTKQNVLLVDHPSGYLAGVGNINFYANSGQLSDYIVTIASPESGVVIKQRFLNGIQNKVPDALNNDIDKLDGFEIQYINDSNGLVYGPSANRFVIGSYDNTSVPVNTLSLMQKNQDEGILCLTNLSPASQNLLPATTFNIRSANNAIARLTAENEASTKSAIQLVGKLNCLANGFELEYLNGSGVANLNMYKDFIATNYVKLYANKTIGIFTGSGQSNAMLTIGDSTFNNAVISLFQNNTSVPSSSGYAKLYVESKIAPKQIHTAILIDGSGNKHDLVINPLNVTDGRGLYTDPSGNTFGGLYCPDNRDDLVGCSGNTGIGSGVLFSITNGDYNSVYGVSSATGITTGSRNTIIGSLNASGIISGNRNIVLGHNSFNAASGTLNNNIVIGNDIVQSFNTDNNFILGNGSVTLLSGRIGPTNAQKFLSMPNGGNFGIYDATNANATIIKAKNIELYDDSGNDYPDNPLVFSFKGVQSADLLLLNHAANSMTNTPNYESPLTPRPYAELRGDIRLRGAIRFSDSTSLDSANFLDDVQEIKSYVENLQSTITVLNSSFVEGYTTSPIPAPQNPASPTQGVMQIRNKNWVVTGEVTLTNRDTTSNIHHGAYVIAIKINDEYRPLWISSKDVTCECCNK
jgi:hypothetical protein